MVSNLLGWVAEWMKCAKYKFGGKYLFVKAPDADTSAEQVQIERQLRSKPSEEKVSGYWLAAQR